MRLSLDASRSIGLATHKRLSQRTSSALSPANYAQVVRTIRGLKQVPARGRPGNEDGTREILFTPMPYIAVYRVKDQTIEVLRIYHTAQHRI
jgi:plasmid stabilization system protein ParE